MIRLIPVLLIGLIAVPLFTSFTIETAAADSSFYETKTLVVIDPPAEFTNKATSLGYKIGKPVLLEALSLNVIEIGLRKGLSLDSALSELEKHFPALIIDNNEI